MSTARKLTGLFDYQRFEHNKRLQALIDDTERRCLRSLSDEELEWVNAAGDGTYPKEKKDGNDND